jgi:predicted DNA-binding protein (MmcQ/YjbR family)
MPTNRSANMIEDSYDLVVSRLPAPQRRELGWRMDH